VTEAAINFFKLYIGDYQRDTGTLTLAEHGAYLLMLQHYYATERALPTGRELHRLLRAETKADRDAIDAVAERFWTEGDGGLINPRADEEIAKGREQAKVNRATAQAREAKRRATKPARIDTRTEHESWTTCEPNHSHSQIKTSEANASGVPPPNPISDPPDPVKAIFDLGVSVLTATGSSEKAARSLVAKARKELGDDGAMAALVAAKSKTNPVEYLGAAIKPDPVADRIREQMGGRVEKLPDGRYRCGGSYFNADGSKRVALC
jgi:uncharacterized protein YdaU (DUF1376 family)